MIRTASERRARGVLTRAALAVACSVVVGNRATAQPVALRIFPPVGETLRMRLDQRVEMSGTTRASTGDTTATMVTTLLVISRAYVERRDRNATILLASTDSVVASSNGADSAWIGVEMRRALQGRQVRLRVAPDGATELVDAGGEANPQLNALFAQMPATLPSGPVEVGRSWSRVMLAPLGAAPGVKAEPGKVQATFTLDSLSRTGDLAYVSLVGTLSRPPSATNAWATLAMSGSMTGNLVVDRRRGWIGEARMTYLVRSVVSPTAGDSSAAIRFRMKVTQWMRVVP